MAAYSSRNIVHVTRNHIEYCNIMAVSVPMPVFFTYRCQ